MTVRRNADFAYHREWRKEHPVAARGEGIYIHDENGRRYIDAVGGVYVVTIGHGVREVASAMAEQAASIAFPYAGAFTSAAELDLAEQVIEMAPKGFSKAYFVAGGSEANEVAFKLARKYQLVKGRTERWRILARWQSYHGSTMAALAASGKVTRRADFHPYMLNFPHVDPPYCYRCPWQATYPGCGVKCVQAVERALTHESSDTVAAIIVEPIGGAASGAVVPPPEYLPRLREICTREDIVFIADEVITGFGRTGAAFAVDHWDVVPDIITCGKGIGSGYAPLGAVLIHDRIYQALVSSPYASAFTGYTYSGHPVSCAAGLQVLRILRREGLIEKAREDGAWFFDNAQQLRRHSVVGDIRGKGLMLGIEFVADAQTKEPFDPSVGFAARVTEECWRRGMIVRSENGTIDGRRGEHIMLTPPLIATRDELSRIIGVLDEAIERTVSQVPGLHSRH